MRVLTVIHGDNVGPDLFADVAAAEGHELQEWDIERQGRPPRRADAVAVFGGHQNVGEEARYPWLHDEYEALREWVDDGVPLLAVCLGAQALAHAFGSPVDRLDEPLAGFYETRLTDDGAADPVLGALPREFECFNGNHYSFELPQEATLLADGPCPQAFRIGARAWAVQFHPEITGQDALSWYDDPEERAAVARVLDDKLPGWLPLGTRLFEAFLGAAVTRTGHSDRPHP